EVFQGRMKTLSFKIFSGLLFRRNDAKDLADAEKLNIKALDAVVVNFYPFEKNMDKNLSTEELTELIDIGGPALVRAAAKNAPDVLVLTSADQYSAVIQDIQSSGSVQKSTAQKCASESWDVIAGYDLAIQSVFGANSLALKYGENPHQTAKLKVQKNSPLDWLNPVTANPLSYNNILDISAGFLLAQDLKKILPESNHVIIVKHNNPCGAASVDKSVENSQLAALELAWNGDPVSAFGGICIFSEKVEPACLKFLEKYFIEAIAAPDLNAATMTEILKARKNLKAISIRHWQNETQLQQTTVVGGTLLQSPDHILLQKEECVTQRPWPKELQKISQFGTAIVKSLKSNAVCIVHQPQPQRFQLLGTGHGLTNRIDCIEKLAIPRAQKILGSSELKNCVLISDAFFPFPDSVEICKKGSIEYIVQPGGSIKDQQVIAACNELNISMILTGTRHFKH
ncbi:MAG: bifunctional phosphoribosylaminoimidazolecarboxamide formyltransferase/IMP cyclohydrolase PurH, partial [Pseudobdellovibrionaceae bacterium]